MSIARTSLTKKAAVAATDTPMLPPEQVVEMLRTLRQQIPEFVQLPNDREMKQLRRMISLNVAFAHEAINAAGASDVVQNVIGSTPDELHRAEDEVARWSAVESELRSMLRGVSAANVIRRHRICQTALQVFNVSKQLVKQEEHANLLPHVELMSRIRKYGRRRAKTAEPPAPQPVQPNPQPPKLP
jgi:hypothetical protein